VRRERGGQGALVVVGDDLLDQPEHGLAVRDRVQPGAPGASDPHMPGVIEHVVLCAGRALVGPATAPVELRPGDYIAYPGDQPHLFQALEPDTTAVLTSEHV